MKKSQHVYLAHYSVTYITYFENPPFETTHIHRKKIGSEIAAYVFYYLAHYSVTYIDNPPFETTHIHRKKNPVVSSSSCKKCRIDFQSNHRNPLPAAAAV